MGVRGLTTYISTNTNLFLQKHRLHDCIVVVDGNNISSQLYIWVSKSNSAFGGDYDRYHRCVRDFFLLLSSCNVTPLVIFDGAYEHRKLATVWERLEGKLQACQRVTPSNQIRRSVFPLLMRETFRDILIDMGISFAQCDFEADEQIAAIARDLSCPVLSYDSDFYVLDVLYIPFNSFDLTKSTFNSDVSGESYFYIGCEIYHVDKFLSKFGGLSRDMLPLMATLLGNDYIRRSVFNGFYAQIHKPRLGKASSEQQRRIAGLLEWLKKESVSSAIPKILGFLKLKDRSDVANQIDRAIAAYSISDSYIKKYLRLPDVIESSSTTYVPSPNVCSSQVESSETTELFSECDAACDVEDDTVDMDFEDRSLNDNLEEIMGSIKSVSSVPDSVPEHFIDQYRKGLIPACFMDLFTTKIYILQPQKEDHASELNSHHICLPVVRFCVSLLLDSDAAAQVKVISYQRTRLSRKLLFSEDITPTSNLPKLSDIPALHYEEKLSLLLQAVGINVDISRFPSEWRLYFLAIIYWAHSSEQNASVEKLVHTLILGVILLSIVRPSKKEQSALGHALAKLCEHVDSEVKDCILNLKKSDSLVAYGSIYAPHSHAESKSYKTSYNVSIVHCLAQFQSILLALSQVNQLLGKIIPSPPLWKLFSGTLLYNIYRALQPRGNVEAYIDLCLGQTPSLLKLHQTLVSLVLGYVSRKLTLMDHITTKKTRRRRSKAKRMTTISSDIEDEIKHLSSDAEVCVDPNNRFSLLSTCE